LSLDRPVLRRHDAADLVAQFSPPATTFDQRDHPARHDACAENRREAVDENDDHRMRPVAGGSRD